jgi:HK97 family phage major capsid protein
MGDEHVTDTPMVPSGISSDEAAKIEKSTLMSVVGNIVKNERDGWMKEVLGELQEFMPPDRSNVPEIQNSKGETVHRTQHTTDPMYRRMSPEMQEVRSPEGDHWMAEWIRAQYNKDQAKMFLANQQLENIYGRADTVIGASTTTGAFAAGTGGVLLPRPLENVVMVARDRVAKMRRFATNLVMTRSNHNVPTAGSMTAAMVLEATTMAASEPAFAQVPLNARKGHVLAVASREILNDAAVNLINTYAVRAGGSLGVLEDDQFFEAGNGTAPNISADLAGDAYTEDTSGILKYGDVVGMYFGVGQAYRDGAVWLAAPNVLQMMSAIVSNGSPFYQGLQERPLAITDDPNAVGTILGKPVYEVPFPNGEIYFGNVAANYVVGTRQGIEVDVSPHVYFTSDKVIWKFTQRFDGNNIDTSAGSHAAGITTAVIGTL